MTSQTPMPSAGTGHSQRAAIVVVPSIVDALDYTPKTAAGFVASSLAAVIPGARVDALHHVDTDLQAVASLVTDQQLDIFEFQYGDALDTAFASELPPIRVWTFLHLMMTSRFPVGIAGAIYAIWVVLPFAVLGSAIGMFLHQLPSDQQGQAFTVAVFAAVLSLLAKPSWRQLYETYRLLTPMAMYYKRWVRRDYIKQSLSSAVRRLRCCGYERVILVGHSFGAAVALEVASELDDDVHKIVTVGSPTRQFQRAGLISTSENDLWSLSAANRGSPNAERWLNIFHELDPMSSKVELQNVTNVGLKHNQSFSRISNATAHSGYLTDCKGAMPAVAKFVLNR